jgi:hypothetical protein
LLKTLLIYTLQFNDGMPAITQITRTHLHPSNVLRLDGCTAHHENLNTVKGSEGTAVLPATMLQLISHLY